MTRRRNKMRPVNRLAATPFKNRIPQQARLLQKESALGFTKGSLPRSTTHIPFNTSCHLHITVFHSNSSTSHRIISHKWCDGSGSVVLTGLRLEANGTSCGNEHIRRPTPAPALRSSRKFGGYAGTRVGEVQNPGPATHERDWTVTEQPDATHRRINEAGDSVPSSQDSVTRAVQNLRVSNFPAASVAQPAPLLPVMGNSRRKPRPKQQPKEPREYLRCALCAVRPGCRLHWHPLTKIKSNAAHWTEAWRSDAA